MIPGEAVVAQRKRMKISQYRLAEQLSIAYGQPIHQSTVSAWETGKIAAPDDILVVMCKIAEKRGRIKEKIAGDVIPYLDRAHINDLSTGITRRATAEETTALAEELADARMAEIQRELEDERKAEPEAPQERETEMENTTITAEPVQRVQNEPETAVISSGIHKPEPKEETPEMAVSGVDKMSFLQIEEKMFAIYRAAECLREHDVEGAPEVLKLAQMQLAQMAGLRYE